MNLGKPSKYEYLLSMYLHRFALVQPAELHSFAVDQMIFSRKKPCNLYFIVRRPRVSVVPGSLKTEEEKISLRIKIQIGEDDTEAEIYLSSSKGWETARLITDYPYHYLHITAKGSTLFSGHVSKLVDQVNFENPFHERMLDYEVLYIGQPIQPDGELMDLKSLVNHSTGQLVFLEAMKNTPDWEVLWMFCCYLPNEISPLSDVLRLPDKITEEDLEIMSSFKAVDRDMLKGRQRANFTEAALVKSFLPLYNLKYNNKFPNPAYVSYKDCEMLPINAITIETDTQKLGKYLYSAKKKRRLLESRYTRQKHQDLVYLQDSNDRYALFHNEYL